MTAIVFHANKTTHNKTGVFNMKRAGCFVKVLIYHVFLTNLIQNKSLFNKSPPTPLCKEGSKNFPLEKGGARGILFETVNTTCFIMITRT